MLTLRGLQFFFIFVMGLSIVLGEDRNKGPFGTLTEYSEGPCVSPEPKGVDKENEKLENDIKTKGFSVAMCSQTFAAILSITWERNTDEMNGTNYYAGKYDSNDGLDVTLYMSTYNEAASVQLRCEVVSVAKKKCYKLPDKEYPITMTNVWTNEKFKLVVGCTSDGHKFWGVFSARPQPEPKDAGMSYGSYYVRMTDKEKQNIFEQVEKFGFKRTKVYEPAYIPL